MAVSTFRMALLGAYFIVAFVVILTAPSAPAYAHTTGMHAVETRAQTHGLVDDMQTVQPCCHQAGTCVVQFVSVGCGLAALDIAPRMTDREFSAVRYVSVLLVADPPPPRP